jgi:gallate dioxygenase
MARIIGGIACSHTPTIGFAVDKNKQDDPVWAPIFEAFAPVRQWLDERKPDVLFFIYNDHVTSFFFDHYSAFTLGVGEQYAVADEGGGARDLPPSRATRRWRGTSANRWWPTSSTCPSSRTRRWTTACSRRCRCCARMSRPGRCPSCRCRSVCCSRLRPRRGAATSSGQALRRAIESYPEDISVAIVATGGVSHQVHGERAGFNNTAWDAQFLDLVENDPVRITRT